MNKKKEEIYKAIHEHTKTCLKKNQFEKMNYDATNLSLDLQMERSNVSRILNQLHQEGLLIKIQGRPTLFAAKKPIDDLNKDVYIPTTIPKGKNIKDYLELTNSFTKLRKQSSFEQDIYLRENSSLYEPIQKAKAAVLYPPRGLNTLIYGEPCTGKVNFAKSMYEFSIEKNIFKESMRYYHIDCLNYESDSNDNILKDFYGYQENDSIHKGHFEKTRNGILVIDHIDRLPRGVLSNIYNTIVNGFYSPINASSKTVEVKSLIIAISDDESLSKDPNVKRSFPMQIRIPSLKEKSIHELLVLTLQYFQEEAIRIEKTIRISKDVLSCFIMSNYSGNLPHLHAEIIQSCSNGYHKFVDNEELFINVDFNDISTPVLNNIFDVNERINELNNILNLFSNDYFFFSPVQDNKELLFLYELNDHSQSEEPLLANIEDKLINQCIKDIDNASKVELNTIRSVMVKRIYDDLYPIMLNNSITKNENLLYGLLQHISNSINQIRSGQINNDYIMNDYKIAKQTDYDCAKKIYKKIKESYSLILPDVELEYIATYLYLSSQWINNNYIQLLIVSEDRDTAKDYVEYINSLNFKSTANWLAIDPDKKNDDLCKEITIKIDQINKEKGVVIATDSQLVQNLESEIKGNTTTEFIIIPNISLQSLVKIAGKMESLGTTINSMSYFDLSKPNDGTDELSTEYHAQTLIKQITDKVLAESLIFLNASKACQSLFNVLINILHDLSISYSDDLLIKFLFHCSFTIERCIKKEPMVYPKDRAIINTYSDIYYSVEKNFEIITEIFSTTIPASEFALITEIFIPYINQN